MSQVEATMPPMTSEEISQYLKDCRLAFVDHPNAPGYSLVGRDTLWEVTYHHDEWWLRMHTGTTFEMGESVVKRALV